MRQQQARLGGDEGARVEGAAAHDEVALGRQQGGFARLHGGQHAALGGENFDLAQAGERVQHGAAQARHREPGARGCFAAPPAPRRSGR